METGKKIDKIIEQCNVLKKNGEELSPELLYQMLKTLNSAVLEESKYIDQLAKESDELLSKVDELELQLYICEGVIALLQDFIEHKGLSDELTTYIDSKGKEKAPITVVH